MAASTDGSSDAFRAAYAVQMTDTDYPKINSVSVGFNTSGSGNAMKITSGFISINFHKDLYFHTTNPAGNYRVAHITGNTLPTGATQVPGTPGQITYDGKTWQRVEYIGLRVQNLPGATLENMSPLSETNSISFEIKDVTRPTAGNTTTWEIALPSGLCNWWGATIPTAGVNVRVSFNWETGEVTKYAIAQSMRGPDYVASEYK